MLDWVYNNETLLWWLFIFSIASFLITLIAVPFVLIRIPEDYFSYSQRHRMLEKDQNRLIRLGLIIIKNLLGFILVLLGMAMLILPGQGLLTIIIGLVLMNFPGKYKLERWIITRPAVLHSINWIRLKAGKAELLDSPD